MINAVTGTIMSVPDDLVERYKAAGHRLAAAPVEEPAATTEPSPAPAAAPAAQPKAPAKKAPARKPPERKTPARKTAK